MITIPELAAEALGSQLAERMRRRFGSTDGDLIERVQSAARLALDCIGNSDALYHNVEHTMLVTLVGYDILRGRQLLIETSASDYAHLIFACLFHDIGYVRGILNGDSPDSYIIDVKGNKAKLPRGSSDAALKPYHVDRSKLFVLDRVAQHKSLDATRIANAIECTRFPPPHGADYSDNEDGMLVRAADLIGQLGDPHYLRKANALYYEFEEVG
ncbi:MAG: metal-dependent phosphohydrolase, partial [Hyphomicrobiales bacterium]